MEENIKKLITEPLKDENIYLVDVKFSEEDGEKTIFITIDSNNGVDTDLCVKATRIIEPVIDELGLRDEYVLDVGSKGE